MISIILSLISGLLTGLSFNFPSFSFLIWFSLVPFIYAVSKGRLNLVILSGITFAFAFYGLVLFWVVNVTGLGLILLLCYLSLYYIIFSFLGQRLIKRPLRIVTLPCLWVVLEFLKEIIWCGFGWANLGYSQYKNFYLIQIADLGGVKLISFLIVMVNVLIAEIIFSNGLFRVLSSKNQQAAPRQRPGYFSQLIRGANPVRDTKTAICRNKISNGASRGILIVLIFLVCFLYSFYRLVNLKEIDSVEVSIVQPNILQELKWNPRFDLKTLDILNNLAEKSGKDTLVIFPEASWPLIINKDNLYELERFIRNINRDAIIGAVTEDKGEFYNEALLFDRKAKLINTYRKIKLVPFGEYVPLRKFLSFINALNSIGDMSRGEDFVRFIFKDRSFSVLICFEDIFPKHVLKFSRDNDFLVNITNDAWFKGEPEASQHFGVMVLRAVENRISIIRSANTGISGWVSFRGEIEKFRRDNKEVFFPGTRNFKVSLNKNRSFYNKYGELFPFLCAGFLLLIMGSGLNFQHFARTTVVNKQNVEN